MTVKTVADEQLKERLGEIATRQWELFRRVKEGTLDPGWVQDGLQDLIMGGEWTEEILTREKKCHQAFFGQEFDLAGFKKTLQHYGRDEIKRWHKLGLEPHFFPKVDMRTRAEFPGWKIKPRKWYYNVANYGFVVLRRRPNGELAPDKEPFGIGGSVLIDTRLKPSYRESDCCYQMYKDDNLLGPIIQQLREEEKIRSSDPPSSRFGIPSSDWDREVKPALARLLRFHVSQVRLERVFEANIIPQLYPYMPRRDDGKTQTDVLYEEFFWGENNRLYGGSSFHGGLAFVDRMLLAGWDEICAPYSARLLVML